ncbi:MAG TPA: serine/threonine protein kinase, partial [Pirellulaceae bacterium]|nr:serine/threonine protein kinase [Pirellulaceae bacterium]
LGTVPASLSVKGHGELNGTELVTGPGNTHAAIEVTAQFGELTSKARVRAVPPLPWAFDFNDGQVPVTWIGAAYRHQPTEFAGEKVLVKVSTIPKGTRSQLWMGHSHWSDYTVEADVYATGSQESKPDMGLVNQRYTLDLMGKNQLQIRSWTPRLELRFAKTIPFEWQTETWYRIKFQGSNEADRIVLRGKVWPRGEPEPEEWMIEAADLTPNRHGAPGLFGNSTAAPFYVDNVEVYANRD